jgi:6-phosphogluconolactonase
MQLANYRKRAPLKFAIGFLGIILSVALLITTGCSSGSASFQTPPPSPPPTPQQKVAFAYTANEGGSISGYSVNSSTGVLTPLTGFPVTTGGNLSFVTHDPLNKFLVAADIAQAFIHVYSINATSGALTEVSPSPYSVEAEPRALAFDPSGRFLYIVSQQENSVTAFTMSSSGVLSAVANSPFPTGGTSGVGCCVVVNSTSQFAYVADLNNVYAFSIDSSTGALTLVNTVSGPTEAGGLALDPSGSSLYAVGAGSNSIQSYSIDSATGALTTGASSSLALQDGAYTIAIDPSGKFAYTVEDSQSLEAYTLASGSFTSMATYSGALGSLQLAIDPSGSFVYAPETGSDDNVSGFLIGTSGTLSNISGSPTAAGHWPMSITLISE